MENHHRVIITESPSSLGHHHQASISPSPIYHLLGIITTSSSCAHHRVIVAQPSSQGRHVFRIIPCSDTWQPVNLVFLLCAQICSLSQQKDSAVSRGASSRHGELPWQLSRQLRNRHTWQLRASCPGITKRCCCASHRTLDNYSTSAAAEGPHNSGGRGLSTTAVFSSAKLPRLVSHLGDGA